MMGYLRAHSHQASAFTHALTLEKNTVVSIASFIPSIGISINTSIKIQKDSGYDLRLIYSRAKVKATSLPLVDRGSNLLFTLK